MVYFAAGVSGFTGIIEAFFVKDTLNLSPAVLASLGFWAGLPWAMKMPLGHLVDRYWRHKALLVYLGAALMAAFTNLALSASQLATTYLNRIFVGRTRPLRRARFAHDRDHGRGPGAADPDGLGGAQAAPWAARAGGCRGPRRAAAFSRPVMRS
jgi:hypothetical protein